MSPIAESFIAHYGEMGSRWGINRTVGEVYALLLITENPVNAEFIGEVLGVSRSNISISLKELESWRLVKLTRIPGDRREYYSTLGSVWEIFQAVAAERRRREVEPTLTMLRQALLKPIIDDSERYVVERLREMYELTELANNWFDDLQRLSPDSMRQLMSLGGKIRKLLLLKDKTMSAVNGMDV